MCGWTCAGPHVQVQIQILHTHTLVQTYLSSISGGEDPHGSSALFHIPEEPQSRHLMGFRGHVHVDKQCGEATNST